MTKRTKRWLRVSLLGLLGLVVGGAGLTVYLLQRPPMMYRHARQVLDQTTERAREQLRDGVLLRLADLTQDSENIEASDEPIERRPLPKVQRFDAFGSLEVLQETQASAVIRRTTPRAKPDEKVDRFVELTLNNEEMVSFVSEIFVDWTIQRGYVIPGGVNDPVVTVKDGKLALAFAIQTPRWKQVFSGDLELVFQDDGMAVGRVTGLRAGSLPIDLTSVGDVLNRRMATSDIVHAQRLSGWLDKLDHFEFRPVIELENRRRVRVYAMEPSKDAVTLKLRVQDRLTYKEHNAMLDSGELAVTDQFGPESWDGSVFVGVPTTTD